MSSSTIYQVPDPILNQVSQSITVVDSATRDLANELLHWLDSNALGLAAVQIGELVRIIAVKRNAESLVIINPRIVRVSEQVHPSIEACLSLSHGKAFYKVRRHKIVKVIGINLFEETVSYKGRDLFGAVLQHEIDHLDGKTINQHGEVYYEGRLREVFDTTELL